MTKNNKSHKQIMADTIKVVLPSGDYEESPDNKLSNWAGISLGAASRKDKIDGFYRPRVKIKHCTGNLTIEFSPAKLMYGNNLQLVAIEDFPKVLQLLQLHLKDYGIETTTEKLAAAAILRFDVGYNVYLPDSVPVKAILATLNRCLTSGHKHQFRIQYENGGCSLRIGTSTVDLLLYNKLQAPEAMGGVDYYKQKPLKEILPGFRNNILRIEKRFTKPKAVKKIFKECYGIYNPVLSDLCHPTMGQDILLTEWQSLLDSCLMPIQHDEDMLTQLTNFLRDNPSACPKHALVYLGLQQLLENHAVWEIKEQLLSHSNYQTVSNLFNEVKRWKVPYDISVWEWLDRITDCLALNAWVEPAFEDPENEPEKTNYQDNRLKRKSVPDKEVNTDGK